QVRNARYVWAQGGTPGRPSTAWDVMNDPSLNPMSWGRKPVFAFYVGYEGGEAEGGIDIPRSGLGARHPITFQDGGSGVIGVDGKIQGELDGRYVVPASGGKLVFVPGDRNKIYVLQERDKNDRVGLDRVSEGKKIKGRPYQYTSRQPQNQFAQQRTG